MTSLLFYGSTANGLNYTLSTNCAVRLHLDRLGELAEPHVEAWWDRAGLRSNTWLPTKNNSGFKTTPDCSRDATCPATNPLLS
jgi:hypothetical protein